MAGRQSLGEPNSNDCDLEISTEIFLVNEKICFQKDDVSHLSDNDIGSCDCGKRSCLSNCRRDFWGYQLIILFCSFLCYIIVGGLCYNVGIYYAAWMDEFEAGSAITSWLGSVHMGMITLVAPLSSFLTDRIGFRPVIMAGGLVSTCGLLATVFVKSISSLLITFSLITPIGLGMAYVPASTIVSLYFDRGRVIANGLVASGAGFGNFIMAYILYTAIDTLNWRGSMFVMAGFCLQFCVLGALMREPETWTELKRQKKMKSNGSRSEKVLGFHLYKRIGMVLFFIHMLLVNAGNSIVFVHVTAITQSLGGVTRAKATLAISLIGLSSTFGRIACGFIGQHKNVDTFLYYILNLTLSGLSAILVPFLSFYSVILTWTVVFGLLMAPNIALMQIIILHFIELEDLNMAFAHTVSFLALGYIVGAPAAGWLFDFTQDYSGSFFLGGSFVTVGSLLLIIPYIRRRKDAKLSTTVELDDHLKSTSLFGSVIGSQYFEAVRSHDELR